MKVLVVGPFVPWPLDSGGRIRTFHLARAASRAGVELEGWFVGDDRDPRALERELERAGGFAVRVFDRTRVGAFERFTRAKYERWFASDHLRDALRARFESDPPDLVHADEMSVLRSVPRTPCPLVVHHHKLDLEFHARAYGDGLAARFDRAKVRGLETRAAQRTLHHVVCSEDDRDALLDRHPSLVVTAVPSGVDERAFDPDAFCADAPLAREPRRLLVLGSLDYEPNVDGLEWLARDVLPRVDADATVRVVGRDPIERVRDLCAQDARLELVGPVDDVREELARASLLLVPLRIGGGTRLKIVEALAMTTPVLSTTIGAEGLDLDADQIERADDAASFAAAIATHLGAPDAAYGRGARGRATVLERLTWDALAARVLGAWRDAADRAPRIG